MAAIQIPAKTVEHAIRREAVRYVRAQRAMTRRAKLRCVRSTAIAARDGIPTAWPVPRVDRESVDLIVRVPLRRLRSRVRK